MPTPEVPRGRGWLGCENRVAWLLRTNRLYGADPRLAVGANFARAFRGGCTRRSVDGAQVSRWERVVQPTDYQVLARYEELLRGGIRIWE